FGQLALFFLLRLGFFGLLLFGFFLFCLGFGLLGRQRLLFLQFFPLVARLLFLGTLLLLQLGLAFFLFFLVLFLAFQRDVGLAWLRGLLDLGRRRRWRGCGSRCRRGSGRWWWRRRRCHGVRRGLLGHGGPELGLHRGLV